MGKSSEARGNKRRFGRSGAIAPRRGPPAIFVTCESGREGKCRREALELLHHYYYASRPALQQDSKDDDAPAAAKTESSEEQPLSLEEELAMLRKGAVAEEVLAYEPNSKRPRTGATNASPRKMSSMKSPFSVYDTGLRGTVCILCTLPGCEMVPYDDIMSEIRASKDKGREATKDDNKIDDTAASDEKKDPSSGEKQVKPTSKEAEYAGKSTNTPANETPLWDPVETVRCILRDAKPVDKDDSDACNDGSTGKEGESEKSGQDEASAVKDASAPGSRFVTRIIPIQATCYASVEEIKAVSMSLLKRCLPKCQAILSKTDKEVTFKLEVKRRLCSHLTRDQVIEAVTPLVMRGIEEMPGYKFSVKLSDPDFQVRVETCKGLCGISILPRESVYRNFNLAELIHPSVDTKQQ